MLDYKKYSVFAVLEWRLFKVKFKLEIIRKEVFSTNCWVIMEVSSVSDEQDLASRPCEYGVAVTNK